jgi:hypothetical protein
MSRLGSTAAEHLAALGTVAIEPGLSEAELTGIEAEFGFAFADDHRAFLAAGLPVGGTWPDWRGAGRRSLATRLQLPVDGILFAVEWRDFWDDGWGARPARMRDALRTAKYRLDRVPRMVPLCSHHYLPAGVPGHPVLSIYQTDISVCAADLLDYIDTHFGQGRPDARPVATPTVAFWSDHVR